MDQPITEWSEAAVAAWLTTLGFAQYEQQMKQHRIAGDVLCRLDLEYLKEIGVDSVGQRLAILKAIYNVKVAQNEPMEPGDYIPPSELEEKRTITLERLHDLVKEQGERIVFLEQENRMLNQRVQVCLEELGTVASRRSDDERGMRRQPSMKWAPIGKGARSPTKPVPDDDSPHTSPSKPEHDIPPQSSRLNRDPIDRPPGPSRSASSTLIVSPNGSTPISRGSPASTTRSDTSTAESLRSFKVSLEDPTWKVLPAALKKYKINNEDWRNYAMFICYGATDRCLSYDEKPLLLFQKLKDAGKNPVFMLKHIKDIRSPIAQAQQKQQARLNLRAENAKDPQQGPGRTSSHPTVRAATMGARLGTPGTSGSSPNSQWPEALSPVDNKHDDGEIKVSYAVAIYPYLAEQDDEFDVTVGDTFVILSRSKGWWVVQRDHHGNGLVELELSKQAWVPAGCLLETASPVLAGDPGPSAAKISIPPSNIVSTSYPGVALMEYRRKGDDELDLNTDESLRVFKRYNHWSYVVKEESGERGWVPSWFIGKVMTSAGVPATPNSLTIPGSLTNAPITFSQGDGLQSSPLSNSFSFTGRSAPGV